MLRLLIALMFLPLAVAAEDSRLQLMDTREEGRGWEAVGRINISGRGYCTGTLVTPSTVLTAAHCIVTEDGAIPVTSLQFLAGFRNGQALAYRGVVRALAHPEYQPGSEDRVEDGTDLALLELDQPIRNPGIQPVPLARPIQREQRIGIVSYGKGRDDAPSLQRACSLLGRRGDLSMLSCDVDFGSSGAPVFRFDKPSPRLWAVVSAMGDRDGNKISLVVDLGDNYHALAHAFANGQGELAHPVERVQRRITIGERPETGAKFIRP